jgi:AbrB family looped-hinge helix DNA binding protein
VVYYVHARHTKEDRRQTTTVSAKGWVVIPKSIREKHGLKKGSRVQVLDYGEILAIVPLPDDPIEALHGMFEGGPSLTGELLAERELQRAREERTGE